MVFRHFIVGLNLRRNKAIGENFGYISISTKFIFKTFRQVKIKCVQLLRIALKQTGN